MKFRDHPLMTRKSGVRAWPPLWVHVSGPPLGRPRGEIGVLKRVEKHPDIIEGLFLWIDYQDESYIGMMYFDDPSFCFALHKILAQSIGWSIVEIGNLDISHLL
jgi:hypothetical protein